MTASSWPHVPPAAAFGDAELVFAGHPDKIPGVSGPVFGRSDEWAADAIRRPSNKSPGAWKLRFPVEPAWNLRAREASFALLNPGHQALREAGVHLPAQPAALQTLALLCHHLAMVMRWARQHALPADLPAWTGTHWDAFLEEAAGRLGPSAVTGYVSSIRRLVVLAPVLTGGGPREDPWPNRTAADVGRRATRPVSTPAIPPGTWWPLLRAAWTYIDVFAGDLLDLRDRAAAASGAGRVPGSQASAGYDQLVAGWLADPANLVPVHDRAWRDVPAGAPRWGALSLLITSGATDSVFAAGYRRAAARRILIETAVAGGRTRPLRNGQAIPGTAQSPPQHRNRSTAYLDAGLVRWLADPASLIPVRGRGHRNGPAGTVLWTTLGRLIYPGDRSSHIFEGAAGQRRRDLVTAAAATGRVHLADGETDPALGRLDCAGFTVVTRADGTTGPWRQRLSPDQLGHELRMLRAAIYIFVAGLSMMRDSEIQEIQRGAVTTHYGSPAVTSHKTKLDPARPQLRWWITEPVAQAIAMGERLSRHPTHIFATLNPPAADPAEGVIRSGRRGIDASDDIDLFIAHINTAGHGLGLQPIPATRVRPHMFRKTMSIITGQEPDSEIALGLQLKHAARRALANAATPGYAAPDTAWASELGSQLELTAARRMTDLLHARRDGHAVAVGPGAARLHAGLDKVNAALGSAPALHAQHADQRTEITLLRDEFADLHFGTINHCLWDPAQAECQNALPPAQRGQAPLIGACHPARCRNSAVTATHAPAWLAEEADLTAMLRQTRLAPPRKQALQQRLTDVQRITGAWHQQGH